MGDKSGRKPSPNLLFARAAGVSKKVVDNAGGAHRLTALDPAVQRLLMGVSRKEESPDLERKPAMRATMDDVEELFEAVEAKKRLMNSWKGDGVDYERAVALYMADQEVSRERAVLRIVEMESLTGVTLERG